MSPRCQIEFLAMLFINSCVVKEVRAKVFHINVICGIVHDIDLSCISSCEAQKDDWTLFNYGLYYD